MNQHDTRLRTIALIRAVHRGDQHAIDALTRSVNNDDADLFCDLTAFAGSLVGYISRFECGGKVTVDELLEDLAQHHIVEAARA